MKTLFLIFLLFNLSCGKHSSDSSEEVQSTPPTSVELPSDPIAEVILTTPHGDNILASMAYKAADQQQGLQGVRAEDFSDSMGKLFIYFTDSSRTFWMPNTFFALDIIYLDQNLVIKEIVWALPSYQGNVNSEIPRAPAVTSRHVLEMKSGSPISSSLRIGDQLKWVSSLSQSETLLRMKQSN